MHLSTIVHLIRSVPTIAPVVGIPVLATSSVWVSHVISTLIVGFMEVAAAEEKSTNWEENVA